MISLPPQGPLIGGNPSAHLIFVDEYLPGFPALTAAGLDRLQAVGDYRFRPVVGERSGFLWDDWRDGDAVRRWLATLPADGPSGDLFARLGQSPGPVPAAGVKYVRGPPCRDR